MEIFLNKLIEYVPYIVAFISSVVTSILFFSVMTSHSEKMKTRLRIKQHMQRMDGAFKVVLDSEQFESKLRSAGIPTVITAFRYKLAFNLILLTVVTTYVFYPYMTEGSLSRLSFILIIGYIILLSPDIGLVKLVLKKLINYREERRKSEIFIFYDLILNAVEAQKINRINTYNIIRGIRPFFNEIQSEIDQLLSSWNLIGGAEKALMTFANQIDTDEARALVPVLSTLDHNDRETAIKTLEGLDDLFSKKQIESYRLRRQLTRDVFNAGIKTTHVLIGINLLAVIIIMVQNIIEGGRL